MIKDFKTLCNHAKDSSLIEKKIFNKNFYYKYLIKTSLINMNVHDLSVDNFFSLQQTIVLPKAYAKKKDLQAYSLNLKSYNFRSINNFKCSFEIPTFSSKSTKINSLKKINSFFNQRSKKLNAILILAVVKGGFRVYSSVGVLGFLPRSHLRKILSSLDCKSRFLIVSSFHIKAFSLLWILVKESKISIRSFIKPKFIRRKNKKRTYSNFMFLFDKYKKKNKNKKKLKKK